jgi:hypothetical protein
MQTNPANPAKKCGSQRTLSSQSFILPMVVTTRRRSKLAPKPPTPTPSTPPVRRGPANVARHIPSSPADDASVSSQASYISSTDGQRGLSSHLKKQLLIDVEKTGGIDNFDTTAVDTFSKSLQRLLDNRIEIYGKVGDPKRIKIGRLVHYWKKLSKEGDKYNNILNEHRVKSFANLLRAEKKKRGLTRDHDDTSISSDDSSIRSDDSSSVSSKEEERNIPSRVTPSKGPPPSRVTPSKGPPSPQVVNNTPSTPRPAATTKMASSHTSVPSSVTSSSSSSGMNHNFGTFLPGITTY